MNQTNHSWNQTSRLTIPAIFVTLLLLLWVSLSTQADNILTSGTTLKGTAGTFLVSSTALNIKSGATVDNAGTLTLKNNLTNENVSPNSIGSGTVELSGTINQTISGQNIIQNLTVNNAAGVTIGDNTKVNGILTLTNGTITLGSDNLLLGPSATISGTPSASVMIIVTSTGELRKEFPAGFTGIFTFPVGDDNGTSEYSPVTLTFTGGTFSASNYVGVSLRNEIYPDPNITGNYLNRYWNISQSGITNFNCNATFQYLSADVVGTENKLSCTKVNTSLWITYSPTNTASHILSANGIVAFGSYTGLKSTTTPLNQELANVDIPNGVTTCYDAQQILTVAGNGTTFLVESGGNVTLVAGSSILLLEGTTVNSGGYFHGYITTNGTYCGTMLNPLVANNQNEQTLGVETVVKKQFIKIYPNPTTDMVIVELMEAGTTTTANITVYSMQGGKLLQKTLNNESKFQFSLSGKPVGIYLVHVQSGDRSEIAKVVKN
jgi:Secretion system C-terminal sorting domain